MTDHPTTEFYFVMAYTFCRLKVYDTEAEFARKLLKVLEKTEVIELCEKKDSKSWQSIDTRILMDLLKQALPLLVTEEISQMVGAPLK